MPKPKPKDRPFYWLPAPPKPPDYSTPEQVTLRAQEAAWEGGCPSRRCGACRWTAHVKMVRAAREALKTDGKLYREFRAAIDRAQRELALS